MKFVRCFFPLLLGLVSLSALAVPSITVSDSYSEKIISVKDLDGMKHCADDTNGVASFRATVPIDPAVDISSFDESTGIGFSFAGGEMNLTLGEDSTYKPGRKSFVRRFFADEFEEGASHVQVGQFTASWTKTTLTVNASAKADYFDFYHKYGNQPGDEFKTYKYSNDVYVASVYLGDSYFSDSVYVKGQNSFSHIFKSCNTNDPVQEYILNNGTFIGQTDYTEPIVTITSPKPNQIFKGGASITISGKAEDNIVFTPFAQDQDREYSLILFWNNDEPVFISASERTNKISWSTTKILLPGTNTFSALAIDEVGNVSREVSRTFFYSVLSPITLTVNDTNRGTITGLKDQQMLEIGRGYKVTATPRKFVVDGVPVEQLLLNWTSDGGIYGETTSSTLNFIMTEGLALQANFGDNPFLSLPTSAGGTFCGLFSTLSGEARPATGSPLSNENSSSNKYQFGYITLTTTGTKGGYTAKIISSGETLSWSGQTFVDPENYIFGNFRVFSRALIKTILDDRDHHLGGYLYANLWIDFSVDGDTIHGTIEKTDSLNGPDFTTLANIQTVRSAYEGTPAPGTFNFVIPGSLDDPAAAPGGFGYGTVAISKNGAARVSLNLADGSPTVSFATFLAADGTFPLFASTRHGRGAFFGWAGFQDDNTLAVNGANWLCLSDTSRGTIYTNEFQFPEFSFSGVRYVTPTPDAPVVGWDTGLFQFGGGNLDFTGSFDAMFQNNKFSFIPDSENPDKQATVPFASSTGMISGTFKPSADARPISYKGIVLPQGLGSGAGFGFFKGTNQTGYIYIGTGDFQP